MSATGRGAPAQSATADREIVISQVINAPREVVFQAFTEVRHVSRWWGPDGFTTTTRAFEFRVGGAWDFVMHGPDGTDYSERRPVSRRNLIDEFSVTLAPQKSEPSRAPYTAAMSI